MERHEIGIVIPAFNESKSIQKVVQSISQYGYTIVIDDASSDSTGMLAESAGAIVVTHNSNMGYDDALNSGFEKAVQIGCKYIITFDADGQHDHSLIPVYLHHLEKYDLVLGVRPEKARFAEIVMGYYFQLRYGIRDILCGMKGYRISLYLENGRFDHIKSIGAELAIVSIKRGCSFTQIPVPIHTRRDKPRFGSRLTSNMRILKALWNLIIFTDMKRLKKDDYFRQKNPCNHPRSGRKQTNS